jgi:hypothetical protein
MAPVEDDKPDSADPVASPIEAMQGSGDLELEVAITKLRGSIMRVVVELDRFCDTVRKARESVVQMAGLVEEPIDDK